MSELAAVMAPLADLDSRQWVAITFATLALGTYSTAMILVGMWAGRR